MGEAAHRDVGGIAFPTGLFGSKFYQDKALVWARSSVRIQVEDAS